MDPKELRIGNYIQTTGCKIYGETHISMIVGIQANGKTHATGVNWSGSTESNDAIPLTGDMVIKLGFEFDNESGWLTYEGIKLWEDDGKYYHINSELLIHFDYVHQLQDFCYVCGEELALIKDDKA